jgi:hypothetical protein
MIDVKNICFGFGWTTEAQQIGKQQSYVAVATATPFVLHGENSIIIV